MITQVILAFWLVLAYDLLEKRRTIDVIITKFFPLCFKMTESFENLDNILCDWAKEKVLKTSCRGIEQVWETVRRKKNPFLFLNITQKKYSSSLNWQPSETRPNTKLVITLYKILRD